MTNQLKNASRLLSLITLLCLAVITLLTTTAFATDPCAAFNFAGGPFSNGGSDAQGHGCTGCSGSHHWKWTFSTLTTYRSADGLASGGPCIGALDLTADVTASDTGAILVPTYHAFGRVAEGGIVISNGGLPTPPVNGGALASVKVCVFSSSCIFSVSAGGGGPVSATLVGDPNAFLTWKKNIQIAGSPGRTASRQSCNGPSGGGTKDCPSSPLGVKTKDIPWKEVFSDPNGTKPNDRCILFDLKNNEKPECWSWPKRNSGFAWVVYLPKDANGHQDNVHNSEQVLGEFTSQQDHIVEGKDINGNVVRMNNKNGFQWLIDHRSDEDNLIMDKRDKMIRDGELLLWFPNSCWENPPDIPCTSVPGDLKTFEEGAKIASFSLFYQPPPEGVIDLGYGDELRLQASANTVVKHDLSIGRKEHHLTETHDKVHQVVEVWITPKDKH